MPPTHNGLRRTCRLPVEGDLPAPSRGRLIGNEEGQIPLDCRAASCNSPVDTMQGREEHQRRTHCTLSLAFDYAAVLVVMERRANGRDDLNCRWTTQRGTWLLWMLECQRSFPESGHLCSSRLRPSDQLSPTGRSARPFHAWASWDGDSVGDSVGWPGHALSNAAGWYAPPFPADRPSSTAVCGGCWQ
jgi:hypothetical protein